MGKATDFRDQAKGFSCSVKTTRSLHEVLSELGEEALSLAYSEVSAASRWARGAILTTRYGQADGSWGSIFILGMHENLDGTVDDRYDGFNIPREAVLSESDVVPASKRLLERVFRGMPSLKARVRILTDIRGQRLDMEEPQNGGTRKKSHT